MKYMGSKARFAKQLIPILMRNRKPRQWYVEPFCGGCNLIDKISGPRLACDVNPYLIALWRELVNNAWVPPKISREDYHRIRRHPARYPPHLVGWVGFNCSYRGKYFNGFAGVAATKAGGSRDYQAEANRNVAKQVPSLQGVEFKACSYSQIPLPTNSLVYCDPPYVGTTSYADEFDHTDFWRWVRRTAWHGHAVYISEYVAPLDFECIWSQVAKSSLSATGKSGGYKTSVERLFTLRRTPT